MLRIDATLQSRAHAALQSAFPLKNDPRERYLPQYIPFENRFPANRRQLICILTPRPAPSLPPTHRTTGGIRKKTAYKSWSVGRDGSVSRPFQPPVPTAAPTAFATSAYLGSKTRVPSICAICPPHACAGAPMATTGFFKVNFPPRTLLLSSRNIWSMK